MFRKYFARVCGVVGLALWGIVMQTIAMDRPARIETPVQQSLQDVEHNISLARQAARELARKEGAKADREFASGEPISLLKQIMPKEVESLIAQVLLEEDPRYENWRKKVALEARVKPREFAWITPPWQIKDIRFSPDERSFIIIISDKQQRHMPREALFWFDPETNMLSHITTLGGSRSLVDIAFLPDNKLAIASTDRVITLMDLQKKHLLYSVRTPIATASMKVSPDEKKIAVLNTLEQGVVLDAATSKKLYLVQFPELAEEQEDFQKVRGDRFAFSPDSTQFLIVNANADIDIYDAQTGAYLKTLTKPTSSALQPEGAEAQEPAAAEQEEDDEEDENLPLPGVFGATFSADGKKILGYAGGVAWVWDSETGQLLHSLRWELPPDPSLDYAAFNYDGTKILVATAQKILMFDARDGERLPVEIDDTAHGPSNVYRWWSADFFPHNNRIWTFSFAPELLEEGLKLKVFDGDTGAKLQEIELPILSSALVTPGATISLSPQGTKAVIKYWGMHDEPYVYLVSINHAQELNDLTIPEALFLRRLLSLFGSEGIKKFVISPHHREYPLYISLKEKYPQLVEPFVVVQ